MTVGDAVFGPNGEPMRRVKRFYVASTDSWKRLAEMRLERADPASPEHTLALSMLTLIDAYEHARTTDGDIFVEDPT